MYVVRLEQLMIRIIGLRAIRYATEKFKAKFSL